MVGIVVVSHSAHLAEGIVELAKLIAQADWRTEASAPVTNVL